MSVLVIDSLVLRIGGRTLLDGADLSLEPGRRIGLVGRNGAGKSTLLRAVAGDIAPDGGRIHISARARLSRVKQEAPAGPQSLTETVLAADTERLHLLQQAETSDPSGLADIHDRLRAIDADSAPARAAAILAGLGFDQAAQARPVSDFSGGWRMRVALAAALFTAGDLLLLDEPTNHLDMEATLWLEGWLARAPGAALIVSHDRGLLDRCVHGIAHLDRGRLALTPGGYDEFVRLRMERALHQARAADRVAAQRARMQSFVDRFRAKATKARQAQARLKAIAKLPVIDAVIEDAPSRFEFPTSAPLPPPIITLDKVAIGYGDVPVLQDLNATIEPDDRIALLGANGNGKSTLAKLLAGRLAPMAGTMQRAGRLRVGYFAQHQADELDMAGTPVSHMQHALPDATITQARSQLARFGLDADRADTTVALLSGGEKARLLLSLATRDAPQFMILDEPTNHLDLDARDALVRALAEYEGAVLVITHDPHLAELVADRLWLVADGTVQPFDGDLGDYRRHLAEAARPTPKQETVHDAPVRRDDRRDRAEIRAAQAPLRQRARALETLLETLVRERTALEARMAQPEFYAPGNGDAIAAANTQMTVISRQADAAETAWLEVQEKLDRAAGPHP